MTLKALRELFQKQLKDLYPKEEIHSFFHMLCEAYLGKSRIDIALQPFEKVAPESFELFSKALLLLEKQYPIQYIVGKTNFMGLEFEVNTAVLIPRPETEELISWILNDHDKNAVLSVLDIGTGSGCIPIVLAKQLPESNIQTMDVSDKALEIAKNNARKHQVKVDFMHQDVLKLEALTHSYDIIVSNPPYVRESEKEQMRDNVVKYEPDLALFVSDQDPLIFYKHIARLALHTLRSNGSLYFEINQYLGKALCKVLIDLGFKNVEIKKDIFGADRMIRAKKN